MKIDFQYNRSDSHDDISTSAYKFRCYGRYFVLISADVSITGRMSFTFQKYSYNFLTRKGMLTTGHLGEAADKTLTRTLVLPVPKTLGTFAKPSTGVPEVAPELGGSGATFGLGHSLATGRLG